jgi:regulator of replication initiation timing
LAKNPEDFDEIETAIKELSDALINAKGQIELLNKDNKDLNEENKKLREMEEDSLQA